MTKLNVPRNKKNKSSTCVTDRADLSKVCHSSGACVTDRRDFTKVCHSSEPCVTDRADFTKSLSFIRTLRDSHSGFH